MRRRTLAGELVIRILQTFHDHRSMWTLVVAVLLVLATAQLGGFASGVDRPHIVLILVDDMGWNDVGFTGNSDLQTPNIDTLAYNGRILRQHYAQPTCTPSRASLLTGKYPSRTGMQGYPLSPAEPRALPLDQKLLPQYMKDLGYKTHLLGKWHLGYYDWKFTPLARGFDTHFGYMNGFIGYYDHHMNVKNKSGHDFWRGTQQVRHLQGRYVTDLLVEEAERLIENTAAQDEHPMFMLLSHLGVHAGNPGSYHEYPEEDIERFDYIGDENRRKFAAMVWNLDKSVGRVVKSLAKNGLLDDTLIVLMSDNGAQTRGLYANDGSNFPLRGLKFSMFEGGIRTVAAVWNSAIHGKHLGAVESLFHISDWLPTLYAAAGGNLTELSGLDGKNQWSNIVRKRATNNEIEYGNHGQMYDTRKEVLLNMDENLGMMGVRYKNWKYLNGSFLDAAYEGYFGDYRNENYTYTVTELAKSKVAKYLQKAFPTVEVINRSYINQERRRNTIKCEFDPRVPICDLREGPCLFDLDEDACEQTNFAKQKPEITQFMLAKLETYFSQLTPQLNTVDDPEANPNRHGGNWVPWRGGSIRGHNAFYTSSAKSIFLSTKQCIVGAIGGLISQKILLS